MAQAHPHPRAGVAAMALGALGVVFGDIGTSPLYTLRECMNAGHEELRSQAHLTADTLGVLSLIFWALTLVVTVKYLGFIMRADNHGEGGILALLALTPERMGGAAASPGGAGKPAGKGRTARVGWVALLVIAGAALLYGDGIITPAISVLSAFEGVDLATDKFHAFIVPVTCVILFGLFAIQRKGTGTVGALFGPVMVVWFVTIGALGAWQLVKNPGVFQALSPTWGAAFFRDHGVRGIAILGAVVLAVTGGEALYADMGHFGARPIRFSWLLLVMPALILNYFGQGALVLSDAKALENPFFAMVPEGGWTYALVALSGLATIIASQALISGVFSLTHQAVQLGFFPRVTVTHTSREAEGQIYVPEMNWGLAVACIALVLAFRESGKLAAAYGIAVSGTMAITSIVFYVVARSAWGWPQGKALPVLLLFLSFDLPFFAANLTKFMDGGYVPILVGLGFFVVMVNWKVGRAIFAEYVRARMEPMDTFLAALDARCHYRAPGTAVFMASVADGVPPVLAHHLERIGVLHEKVVLVTVLTEHVPSVHRKNRVEATDLGKGFWRVVARYGFMEQPSVPEIVTDAKERFGLPVDLGKVTYYVGRETFLATRAGKMGPWAEGLFGFLARNARSATSYFRIPHEQVVELGSQIDL